jgi:hypothetical protein
LREKSSVDEACRRAQQEHDAGGGRTARVGTAERPLLAPVGAPVVDVFQQRYDEARARFVEASRELSGAAVTSDLYAVIDLRDRIDGLLEAWVFVADEVDASTDFADHPVELRAGLIASWLDLARDAEAGPDEISDELRAHLLPRSASPGPYG